MTTHTHQGPTNPAAVALGRELKQIRGTTTLRAFARSMGMTSPGPFSQYENGRKPVPEALIERYAARPGVDADALRRLWIDSLHLDDDGPDGSLVAPAPPDHDRSRAPGHRVTLGGWRATAVGGVVLALMSVVGVLAWPSRPGPTSVGSAAPASAVALTVDSPSDLSAVPRPAPLHGHATGIGAGDEVWFAVQGSGQTSFGVGDAPCTVAGTAFDCGQLYLGQNSSADVGRPFTVSFIEVRAGSDDSKSLHAYAARSKVGPHAYDGLPSLPPGAVVVDEVVMTRA